jgi:hypothetical protein
MGCFFAPDVAFTQRQASASKFPLLFNKLRVPSDNAVRWPTLPVRDLAAFP